MKYSRFTRALVLFALMATFLQIGQAQTSTIEVAPAMCTDDGARIQETITITSPSDDAWYIDSYSPFILPDGVLFIDDVGDEFYLSGDNPALDTLAASAGPNDSTIFVLVVFRDPALDFSPVTFTNNSETLMVDLDAFTAPSSGITGNLGAGPTDTVCFDGVPASFNLSTIADSDIQDILWTVTGPGITSTGSGTFMTNGLSFDFPAAGNFTVTAVGTTTSNCPIDSEVAVHVVDTDYMITGPQFACSLGDMTSYSISDDALALYEDITWQINGSTATFVGASQNVSTVTIDWTGASGTATIMVTGNDASGAMCTFTDSFEVTIDDELGASVAGLDDSVFCLGETATLSSQISNIQSISWTTSRGAIIGSSISSDVDISFTTAGLDTIVVTGMTTTGCGIDETIVVTVRDSEAAIVGDLGSCLGATTMYSARYADGTQPTFTSATWSVAPMLGDMDIALSGAVGEFASITWSSFGDFDVTFTGMTEEGCMISNTVTVSVIDTEFMVSGPELVCVGDFNEYVFVQADGSDVLTGNDVSWQIVRERGGNLTPVPEALTDTDMNDTLSHNFFTGTFNDASFYMVIASADTPNGCTVTDTLIVETIGEDDISIIGPEEICAGFRDTIYYLNVPDSIFDAPPVWNVTFANGNPFSPSQWEPFGGDSLRITLPNAVDTLIISASGTINGASCSTTTAVQQVILSDAVSFIGPSEISLCLSEDPAFFILDIDSTDINLDADFFFQLRNNITGEFITQLPFTGTGLPMTGSGSDFSSPVILSDDRTVTTFPECESIAINTTITFSSSMSCGPDIVLVYDAPGSPTDDGVPDEQIITITEAELEANGNQFDVTFDRFGTYSFLCDVPDILGGLGTAGVAEQCFVVEDQSPATTFVTFPEAGEFSIRAQGFTVDGCSIDEEIIVTVKDTNFVIGGDPQVCTGDATQFVFLDGTDNMPIDSTAGDNPIEWFFITDGVSSPLSFNNSAAAAFFEDFEITGALGDSIDITFNQEGSYTLFASATTDCCDVDAVFEVIVRGTEFLLLGSDQVCNGTSSLYTIANLDSSRINDLVADSTMWSLASGLNGQLSGDQRADSIFINWNRTGSFIDLTDTIFFRGVTDDGCVITDTLPVTINTDDFALLGADACVGTPVDINLVNALDSSAIAGLESLIWVINGTDTINMTAMIGRLDQIPSGDMTSPVWTDAGVVTIQAIGSTSTGCSLINESITIEVFGVEQAMIMGDNNTCLGTLRFPSDPDVYTLNIADADITNVLWEVIPQVGAGTSLGPDDDFSVAPSFGATDQSTFTITDWGSFGFDSPSMEDYRIRVTGTTMGGCTFADSLDIIVLAPSNAFPLICNNRVNISLPSSCELQITPDAILENFEFIRDTLGVTADQFEIVITDPVTGRTISENGIVDGSFLNQELQVTVIHECSQQSCWGTVVLEDKNIPDLICGSTVIACDEGFDPFSVDFGEDRLFGFPLPDTNTITIARSGGSENEFVVRGFEQCGDAILTFEDNIQTDICSGAFGTVITREWTLTNQSGLESICTDVINVERLNLDSLIVMFEEELQDTVFECGENISNFVEPDFNLEGFCFNVQFTSSETTELLCNGNPNAFTSIRTYTFLDWCSGEVRTTRQRITVDDNTPPSINLRSNDITTQADQHFCFGIVSIDNNDISISDPNLCSDISSVVVRVFEDDMTGQLIADETFDGNFTELTISDQNILVDLSRIFITVEAMDQCGNLSADTVSRNVIVEDNIMPTAACDDIVTINLNDEGWGIASSQAFDRGSNDNCGPVEICITRLDDLALFDGLDTDGDELVNFADFMSAIADQGRVGTNYSSRTTMVGGVEVISRDGLCTNRLQFECTDAMSSFLGQNVSVELRVTDVNGEASTCTSEVEVRDNGVIDTVLVLSGDQLINCGDDFSQFIPFDDQTVRFLTNCGIPIAPTYMVDTSGINNCGTGVIFRNFTAVDQTGQVFTHTQTINIGTEADIVNPASIPGFWPEDFDGVGCTGSNIAPENLPAEFVPDFDADDFSCSMADLIFDDIVFRNVDGFCVKILRTWTLIDFCQVSATDPNAGRFEHVQILRLTDEDAPVITASAIEERAVTDPTACAAFVTLRVEADDCHDSDDLIWSYTITTDGVVVATGDDNEININLSLGSHAIEYNVEDPCGNVGETFIQQLVVSDPQNICGTDGGGDTDDGGDTGVAALSGRIATERDLTIDNAQVSLFSGSSEMAAISTAIDGVFSFNNVPRAESYEITVERQDDYLNGVTTLDLVLMQRHVLGLDILDSQYKVIASDVDGSNSVSGADLVAMRRLLLGTASDLPIGQPWTFVDGDQTFSSNITPFPYSQSITISNLLVDLNDLAFVGVKMGDVNENVFLESSALAGTRSVAPLKYVIKNNSAGGTTIDIYSDETIDFDGMQMELNFGDALGEIQAVRSDAFAISGDDYRIEDHNLRMTIATPETSRIVEGVLLSIDLSGNVDRADSQDLIDLINDRLQAQIYTSEGGDIKASDIALSEEKVDLADGFVLGQNAPNPFSSTTDIRFYNNVDGMVTTTIYDISGKQVYVDKTYYPVGWHKMSISTDDLDGQGLYIYELNNGTAVIRKKMMALK